MLLIIIWYFFHNYFWPQPWPQPPEIGLGLCLEVLSAFNITDKYDWVDWKCAVLMYPSVLLFVSVIVSASPRLSCCVRAITVVVARRRRAERV